MAIKVMEWNIQGQSGMNKAYGLMSIEKKITACAADIFVLTEFVVAKGLDSFLGKLRAENYSLFFDPNLECRKNYVLIGISNSLAVKNASYDIPQSDGINLLRVRLHLDSGQPLSIIGCRMMTGEKDLRKQYDQERECLEKVLLPLVAENRDLCIVAGDFNNATCYGSLSEKFDAVKANYYKDGEELAQINYNLHIINDRFGDNEFELVDINNGAPIPTHKCFPDDHIFVRGFKKESVRPIPAAKLSDHKIIYAEVSLKTGIHASGCLS